MPINAKYLMPVALGLSLVTVTAFVAYYILKKDEEQKEESTVKSSKVNVIEVTVEKKIVPALIGRSGSNIKDISNKSGAMIHFKKFSDKDYDVCVIRGSTLATQLAETMIHDFIRQQPVIVEENIEVPGWSCGRIIGTGGENINEISHRSGARVKLESSGDKNSVKVVTFRGTKEQIEHAKELILNCVAQEKCRREIEQAKRPRLAPSPSPPPRDEPPGPPGDGRHAKCKRTEIEMNEPSEGFPQEASSSSSIEVYVSAVSSPSRFWVQFVGPQVAQLDDLVAHMTDYYSNKENRTAHALRQVCVGQVVAAVFRHDGRWYRARVHDIRPNEFDATQQVADVFYLDYGDSEYVATHELCELRADLLRLRFQAMECFLAGVKPAGEEEKTEDGAPRWPKWHPQAIERFEELTQVARWKPLLSKTCTYKKTNAIGDTEKEIPGIKLFDNTDEGCVDIGEVLVAEGWARASLSPRASPPPPHTSHTPHTPFGDLSNSRVLGMLAGPGRSSSVPKDHKDDSQKMDSPTESDKISASKSLQSGLESADKLKSISNFDLSYSETGPHINGSNEDFIGSEKQRIENEVHRQGDVPQTPIHTKLAVDEFKANMNRMDSHHNLDALGRHDVHK